ncbi:MAG: GNAT family N-acetyltransferase [Gemmatimonadaceae bacterium]
MNIRIASEGSSSIDAYASVSIAFEVTSVFDTAHLASGDARRLVARLLEHPYIKGGAVVVMNAPDVGMLEGRDDLALLWDLRVAPPFRSGGVGSALVHAAEALAASRGARVIKVETQNINVRACRFYASHGFNLRQANAEVYEAMPHEVQLLWYKSLDKTA